MAKKSPQIPGDVAANAEPAVAAEDAPESAGLPNAVDVDARFLKGPKLTRQGWVVPNEDWQKANRAEFDAHWAAKG